MPPPPSAPTAPPTRPAARPTAKPPPPTARPAWPPAARCRKSSTSSTRSSALERRKNPARRAPRRPGPYTGPDAGEVPKLLKRQAELTGKIDEAELRWLELHEALEAIPAD